MSHAIRALPPPSGYLPDTNARRFSVAANDDRASRTANPSVRAKTIDFEHRTDGDQTKAKLFRFQINPDALGTSDGALRSFEAEPIKAYAADFDNVRPEPNEDVFAGLSLGDPSRNASTFLASFIAQSRLGQGLTHAPHTEASEAYRMAGAVPPMPGTESPILSFTV